MEDHLQRLNDIQARELAAQEEKQRDEEKMKRQLEMEADQRKEIGQLQEAKKNLEEANKQLKEKLREDQKMHAQQVNLVEIYSNKRSILERERPGRGLEKEGRRGSSAGSIEGRGGSIALEDRILEKGLERGKGKGDLSHSYKTQVYIFRIDILFIV